MKNRINSDLNYYLRFHYKCVYNIILKKLYQNEKIKNKSRSITLPSNKY